LFKAMLSYQHIYHAGGWADLHKHAVLCALWDILARDCKALVYADTHAGRGVYDLGAIEAQKTREYETGVVRLSGQRLPVGLKAYRKALEYWMPLYAGSPACIAALMRKRDKQILCELHPQEHAHLQKNLGALEGVTVFKADGHEALLGALPADSRGLILIDPSYEVKTEYMKTAETAKTLRIAYPNMAVLIWYPVLMGRDYYQTLEAGLSGYIVSDFAAPVMPDKGMVRSRLIVLGAPDGFDGVMDGIKNDLQVVLAAR
jgi:23S rRNA (adenine2030-N6)-methyltransferase